MKDLKNLIKVKTKKNYPWSKPYRYITGKDISDYFDEKYPEMKD
jgi:hypothetical protein